MILRKEIAFLSFFCLSLLCYGQHPKIDSLKNILKSAKSVNDSIDAYNDIAFEYIYIKFDSIKPNAERAIRLAEKSNYALGLGTAKKSLSVFYYFSGDRQKSFENIYSSIDIFKAEKDTLKIAKAYNNLATLYKNFGQLHESLKAYDTAIYFNKNLNYDKGLINNYINMAGIYSKQGDFDKSIETYRIADELNENENDLASEASIKSGIGIVYEEQGKFDSAIYLMDESLKIFQKLNKSRNIVAMANNLGNIERKKGNYLRSIEYFNEALESARQINNPRLEAIILNNLANNYLELNDNEKALELYEESSKIIKGIDDYAYAAALSNIFLILQDVDGEESLKYLEEAYAIYERMDSKPNLINNLNNQANYYFSAGDFQLSKNTYLKAKNILKNVNAEYLKSSTWLGLSNTNLALGFIDSAQIYGNEALRLARKTQALSEESEAAELLYKIAKTKNDSQTALEYLELYQKLSDSLFDENKSKALGKLEAELDFKNLTEKLELEREIEKRESELKLQVKQNWIIALIVAIVALILIVILLYVIKRNKTKTNNELKSVSEELHIKNEKLKRLHTQKNRLISIISHDFRGPLNNLSSFLDLYINGNMSKGEFDEWVPKIRASTESTQRLLSNLISWAKQSLNEYKIEKQMIDLHSCVSTILESFDYVIREKKINVINSIPVDAKVFIDKNTIELVVRNLLSNSIKFCNSEDQIKFTFKEKNNFSQICIEDTGVGMKQETADSLFKNDDLISALGTGQEEGSGIGAVLIKNFLEENNGSIWVDYSEVGKGTRICFKVPQKS
jgi:signal transduction histidine kinase